MPQESVSDGSPLGGLIIILFWFGVVYVVFRIVSYRKRYAKLSLKYRDPETVKLIMRKRAWQGMTEEMLLDSWGRAEEKDEKSYKTKTKKVLKYGRKGKNRFANRVVIENGIVVGFDQKKV